MLYIIIYFLYIPSLFCCFSTFIGSSKAEKQDTYIYPYSEPIKTHKHITFYCFLVAFFFLFTRITENEEPQLNFYRLKVQARISEPEIHAWEAWSHSTAGTLMLEGPWEVSSAWNLQAP